MLFSECTGTSSSGLMICIDCVGVLWVPLWVVCLLSWALQGPGSPKGSAAGGAEDGFMLAEVREVIHLMSALCPEMMIKATVRSLKLRKGLGELP